VFSAKLNIAIKIVALGRVVDDGDSDDRKLYEQAETTDDEAPQHRSYLATGS
jgi:hypothetical protein